VNEGEGVDEEDEEDEFYECDEIWNRLGWASMNEL